MIIMAWIVGVSLGVIVLGYYGLPFWGWLVVIALGLMWMKASMAAWGIFVSLSAIAIIPGLRQRLLSQPIMMLVKKFRWLPNISETERAAIEAGTVWVEREFFNSAPNLQRLLSEPYPQMSDELHEFLAGPVEQVCRMTSDWEIYQRKDLPQTVWDYLKQEKFFGMMIPKEYGGFGFTNTAYSAVMSKLASRSFTHVATVGVTNSLGPAKLLLRYGTEKQKQTYLPRLASGDEIPCFALTEPLAGSDAASITSHGVVFKGEDGELYLRLNWQKRYITLGAIATLIGLTFQLRDPSNYLGKGEDVGITCALVPTGLSGVIQNHRHDPMGVPFYNSPLEGHDVVVPIHHIIGGIDGAGQGWTMIMQSLAAGRGVSFPASCAGIAKLVTRVASGHAVVRQQFGLPIGKFGGVEEPLARIIGYSYLVEALRLYTLSAVEQGEQPAVAAAIAKLHSTELTRKLVTDGMDILGGSGICRGPHNLLANVYTAMPIAITVEGANILTRSLMIYGQGAIRCHPYVYDEILGLEANDRTRFDQAFWAHVGSVLSRFCRVKLLTLTHGWIAQTETSKTLAPYQRQLQWASAWFGLLSDMAMVCLGGSLKREEKLTGRLADMMSWLYLGSATLWRYEAEEKDTEILPVIHWVMQTVFAEFQIACDGFIANLPRNWVTGPFLWSMTVAMRNRPIGRSPSDALGHEVAQLIQGNPAVRDRLTQGIYRPSHPDEALGRLDEAVSLSLNSSSIYQQLKASIRAGQLPRQPIKQLVEQALELDIISEQEARLMREAIVSQRQAVQVDSFTLAEYLGQEQFDAPLGFGSPNMHSPSGLRSHTSPKDNT